MRLLIVSHNFLDPRYTGKLDRLGEVADVLLVQPASLPFAGTASIQSTSRYQVATLPAIFPLPVRTSTRWLLAGLAQRIAVFQPDVLLVENEIHSFSTLQTLFLRDRLAPNASVIAAFWQNLPAVGRKAKLITALAAWARPRIDGFLAANEDGRQIMIEAGIDADRIDVFPPIGFDPAWFPTTDQRTVLRTQLGITPDSFVIGFSGRFVPEKGLDILLNAISTLRTEGRCVRGLFVGNGALKPEIAAHPDVVIVSPSQPIEAIPYFSAMDCLVLPSRTIPDWKEQFGRVLVEAMYARVPVIGSDSGAIPDVIGNDGWIMPEGNANALHRAIAEVMDHRTERQHKVATGYDRVTAEFTNAAIADRTIAFTQLLERRR